MPSLDRVDIREPALRTEIIGSNQSNEKRQGFAGNGKFMPMVLSSDEALKSNATELDQAVENVAVYVQNIARDINFSVDANTNTPVVTVTDQFSGEVIRQIPNEEMLEISKSLEDAQRRNSDKVHKGLLFEGDA
ncbi:MAG: flagellar biosynthesis protein FlaG [SAR86 cluster bacterium]|uniref:Flagellar biosynthesis protein FlaG n=1 Tax=SAR86 cluster bacterium TaxID=2030880 RepID=A0A2A4XG39_9GAMM|nr:MAG: flagellar biosynthesis protein FlaG [SAR86 cluster bacterium]